MTGALPPLDPATVSGYVRVGLDNVTREYPNHPAHLLTGPDDLDTPGALHPVFYGSYDWHSAVHQHWMLIRLVRRHPELPEADTVRALFDRHLTRDAVATEDVYLRDPARRAWERPYGWAWLLTLSAELRSWAADDAPRAEEAAPSTGTVGPGPADASRWATILAPLADTVRGRCLQWLASASYPQRSGTHANSAFAAILLHDAALATGDGEVLDAVARAAQRWYSDDVGYPAWLEPSASDFLSPVLVEADLLRRLLPGGAFAERFRRLLPEPGPLTEPVVVSDRTDPQTVHLDGLNLSRAWCWLGVGQQLDIDDPTRDLAITAARAHAGASLPHVVGGDYVGEHWLATFAVHLHDVADRHRHLLDGA